jgi:hypothetical protein
MKIIDLLNLLENKSLYTLWTLYIEFLKNPTEGVNFLHKVLFRGYYEWGEKNVPYAINTILQALLGSPGFEENPENPDHISVILVEILFLLLFIILTYWILYGTLLLFAYVIIPLKIIKNIIWLLKLFLKYWIEEVTNPILKLLEESLFYLKIKLWLKNVLYPMALQLFSVVKLNVLEFWKWLRSKI